MGEINTRRETVGEPGRLRDMQCERQADGETDRERERAGEIDRR